MGRGEGGEGRGGEQLEEELLLLLLWRWRSVRPSVERGRRERRGEDERDYSSFLPIPSEDEERRNVMTRKRMEEEGKKVEN